MVSICPEDHPEMRTRTCWQIPTMGTSYTFCIDHPTSYWFLAGIGVEGSFPIFLGNPGWHLGSDRQTHCRVLPHILMSLFKPRGWQVQNSPVHERFLFQPWALAATEGKLQPFLVQLGLLRVSHRLTVGLPHPSWAWVTCCLLSSPSHLSFPLRQR